MGNILLGNNQDMVKIGWTALIAVSLSSFIISLDSTFMNVAISNLVVDLNTTLSSVQLIIAVYALTMASLMLLGAKLQEVIGRKNTFIAGAFIFGIGTFIATLSINSLMLLIGWSILEGAGAALMLPATASIITGTYSGKNRAFALGIWTAIGGIASATGPLIGGILTTFISWRLGFGIEFIIILLILALSKNLKYFPPSMRFSQLDKLGVLLSSFGIFLIVLGIFSINSYKNFDVPASISGIGILLLILFYFKEKQIIKSGKKPLTDIRLLKNRNFILGLLSRLVLSLALAGAVFILPVFFQQERGANAFTTGLAILPLTLGVLTFSLISSRLSNRIATQHLISIGFLIATLSSFFLSYQFSLNTHIADIVPGTLVLGMGLGLALPLTANIILSSADQDKQSDASGIMSTSISLGSSLGTAIIGIVLIFATLNGLYAAYDHNYQNQFDKNQINQKLTVYEEKLNTTHEVLKSNQSSVLYSVVNETVRNAMRISFEFISFIFLISFIISLFIKPLKLK